MTLYAETSAVLRWLFAEADGDDVRGILATADKIVASRLTLIETRRVVHRAEREGRLTAVQSADVLSVFARAASTWDILQISDDVARRAEDGFPAEPVRTLDAIHLASALILRQAYSDLRMVTTDDRVRRNARLLGLQVSP
ncbi:MAG TPA: type II toxin-antitoxin system VapC family toxin [Candidatus Binatia bacterium]|jgi:predicted nucleic acid-binding protein|nr:type II toxin-antitoxin system VapC family toxin [Candidatus Binatia bacterium]